MAGDSRVWHLPERAVSGPEFYCHANYRGVTGRHYCLDYATVKMQPLGLAGLIAGVVGVCVIMGARFQGGVDVLGVVLCLIGVISLTIATLAMRGAAAGGNLIMVVGLQMLVGSAALAVPALLFEPFEVNWTPRLFAAFTYTTLVPGLAATLVWFMLVD
jgi:drug/metabolite transporter (DMT)-like permease